MHPQPQRRLLKPGGGRGLALAAAMFAVAGCGLTISAGPDGEGPGDERLTVSVTNVGDGFGAVGIVFPAGVSVQDACPAVLGPGESCSPFVLLREQPASIDVEASPEPGSVFVGWTGAECSGPSTECTVLNDSGADDPVIVLAPRFDLAPGS